MSQISERSVANLHPSRVWVTPEAFLVAGLVCLAMALVGTLFAFVPSRESRSQIARLQVSDDPLLLGDVPVGEQRTKTFQIQNKTNQKMSLLAAISDCGCTTLSLSRSEILPNESVSASVTLDTTGMSGPVKRVAALRFKSDDPQRTIDQCSVTLQANVVPVFEVRPEVLNLSRSSRRLRHVLTVATDEAAEVTRVYSPHPCLNCAWHRDEENLIHGFLEVQFDSSKNPDLESSTIFIETSHNREPIIQIPVKIER